MQQSRPIAFFEDRDNGLCIVYLRHTFYNTGVLLVIRLQRSRTAGISCLIVRITLIDNTKCLLYALNKRKMACAKRNTTFFEGF